MQPGHLLCDISTRLLEKRLFHLWCCPMPLCQQQKRKLRLYISNTFNPARPDADDSDGSIASWELRVEGKLLDDVSFVHLKINSVYLIYCFLPVVFNTQTT